MQYSYDNTIRNGYDFPQDVVNQIIFDSYHDKDWVEDIEEIENTIACFLDYYPDLLLYRVRTWFLRGCPLTTNNADALEKFAEVWDASVMKVGMIGPFKSINDIKAKYHLDNYLYNKEQ